MIIVITVICGRLRYRLRYRHRLRLRFRLRFRPLNFPPSQGGLGRVCFSFRSMKKCSLTSPSVSIYICTACLPLLRTLHC